MTLVDYVVYCNSKCHYWFRHSLTFLCMDKHYFKHYALLDNIFVGKLFTRWSCAWFSTIMSIISQFLFSSIRRLLSLGTVVMFSQHYQRCCCRGGFIGCLLGGSLLILLYKPFNNDFIYFFFFFAFWDIPLYVGKRMWCNSWRYITDNLKEATFTEQNGDLPSDADCSS